MCMMNQKPVIYAPCNHCPEFLNSCMPLILNGFIFGECDDFSYCEFCGCYEECTAGSPLACRSEQELMKGVVEREIDELRHADVNHAECQIC